MSRSAGAAGARRWDPTQYAQYAAARLREAYPRRADGRTLYPFRRLFLVASRSTRSV